MRDWLKELTDIDIDCVHRYEYLLNRQLKSYDEYREIDAHVDEIILEWENRIEFFAAYPALRQYTKSQIDHTDEKEAPHAHHPYAGMLPDKPLAGHRGYYPVTSREEWDVLPDLYKVMEWEPVKDPHNKDQLKAVKAVLFDVPYLEPYGVRAKVSVHPADVHQILFCLFPKTECHLYSVCGIELEGGKRLPAEWLQDSTTGAFGIYVHDTCIARQGGFQGYIPEHIERLADGSFRFDQQYGVGKTTYYALHNPYPQAKRQTSIDAQIHQASQKASMSSLSPGAEKCDQKPAR